MDCHGVRENINAYIDSELSEVEMRLVAVHLDSCPSCRHEFSAYSLTRNFIKDNSPVPSPSGLTENIRIMMEKERLIPRRGLLSFRFRKPSIPPRALALAASFILVILLGFSSLKLFLPGSREQKSGAATQAAKQSPPPATAVEPSPEKAEPKVIVSQAASDNAYAPGGHADYGRQETVAPDMAESRATGGSSADKSRALNGIVSRDEAPPAPAPAARNESNRAAPAAPETRPAAKSASVSTSIAAAAQPAPAAAPSRSVGGGGSYTLAMKEKAMPQANVYIMNTTPIPPPLFDGKASADLYLNNTLAMAPGMLPPGPVGEFITQQAIIAPSIIADSLNDSISVAAAAPPADIKLASAGAATASRGRAAESAKAEKPAAVAKAYTENSEEKQIAKRMDSDLAVTEADRAPSKDKKKQKPPLKMAVKAVTKDPEKARQAALQAIKDSGGKARVVDGKIIIESAPAETLSQLQNIKTATGEGTKISIPEKLLNNEAQDESPRTVNTEIIFVEDK